MLHRASFMISWITACLITAGSMFGLSRAAHAFDINAQVPTGKEDFTAFRTDCEVVGWSSDYKDLAMTVLEVVRDRYGEQLGEMLLMIYPVGSMEAFQSSHHLLVTQEPRPFDPAPLETAEDRMYGAGHRAEHQWPRKPGKTRPRGGMRIETLWESHQIEPGICAPSVGYILHWKGQTRYQVHQLLKMRSKCENLKLADERWRWAKNDLAADLIRFDYTSDPENEFSIRFPVSVGWTLAKSISITVRSSYPATHHDVVAAKRQAARFGHVNFQHVNEPIASQILHNAPMTDLAHHIAKNLSTTAVASSQTTDHTLIIDVGPLPAPAVAATHATATTEAEAGESATSANQGDASHRDRGGEADTPPKSSDARSNPDAPESNRQENNKNSNNTDDATYLKNWSP